MKTLSVARLTVKYMFAFFKKTIHLQKTSSESDFFPLTFGIKNVESTMGDLL